MAVANVSVWAAIFARWRCGRCAGVANGCERSTDGPPGPLGAVGLGDRARSGWSSWATPWSRPSRADHPVGPGCSRSHWIAASPSSTLLGLQPLGRDRAWLATWPVIVAAWPWHRCRSSASRRSALTPYLASSRALHAARAVVAVGHVVLVRVAVAAVASGRRRASRSYLLPHGLADHARRATDSTSSVQGAAAGRAAAELALVAERERVARDVHDVLGHSLTVLTVKAELAERLIDVDPERAKSELASIQETARQALAEIRATVGGLRVARLADELEAAPLGPGRRRDRDPGSLRSDGGRPPPPDVLAWVLREAVTNVVRHAGRRPAVIVSSAPGWLVVTDDGRGPGGHPRATVCAACASESPRPVAPSSCGGTTRARRCGCSAERHPGPAGRRPGARARSHGRPADPRARHRRGRRGRTRGRGGRRGPRSRPDVCLLDIEMPGRDGIGVAADADAVTDVGRAGR